MYSLKEVVDEEDAIRTDEHLLKVVHIFHWFLKMQQQLMVIVQHK